ncbi:MAG TPA: hypothetical protein VEI06_11865 [Gemmatimonadaceae bacterium]|nr:hypothetical protein [Gemmatimonadaceae bacterium]
MRVPIHTLALVAALSVACNSSTSNNGGGGGGPKGYVTPSSAERTAASNAFLNMANSLGAAGSRVSALVRPGGVSASVSLPPGSQGIVFTMLSQAILHIDQVTALDASQFKTSVTGTSWHGFAFLATVNNTPAGSGFVISGFVIYDPDLYSSMVLAAGAPLAASGNPPGEAIGSGLAFGELANSPTIVWAANDSAAGSDVAPLTGDLQGTCVTPPPLPTAVTNCTTNGFSTSLTIKTASPDGRVANNSATGSSSATLTGAVRMRGLQFTFDCQVARCAIGASGSISVVSNQVQNGKAVGAKSDPMVAKVTDQGGAPLGGVTVNWTVTPAAAGALASSTTTTADDGTTSNTLTVALPDTTISVVATLANASNVAFLINNCTPGEMRMSFEIQDTTAAGDTLSVFVFLTRLNSQGQPTSGCYSVPVTYSVTAGGGTVGVLVPGSNPPRYTVGPSATVFTDPSGAAHVLWQVGNAGKTLNTVTASSPGMQGSPITFNTSTP